MPSISAIETEVVRTGFSGVIRVERAGDVEFERAYGYADRAHRVPNTPDTRFGMASGTKGLTALTVVSLIAEGSLQPSTTARALLGEDLPLIDDAVTIEQLLSHRSGIGDYFDEEVIASKTDHVLPVPVHELATTEQYLAVLGGHDMVFEPGARFAYNNGAYVVLALIAERASGLPFPELVGRRVCEPAGLGNTAFLRSDELPGSAAIGYLMNEGLRTNVLHLPVEGSGDGGIYTTVADIAALWRAFFEGRIVPADWVGEMTRPRTQASGESMGYGLGFWLHADGGIVELHGYDAGVSFRSTHDPVNSITCTVISNTSEGTWPIETILDEEGVGR